ncbi:MerR family transcriptional regulator [Paenibacillus sp. OSY-SE]|uniref:MerR family transcriptional regulator n=1 Tax=Paenibacillus sp. OSY-SE TaxID=1196323 RepID=UPI0002E7223C
MTSRHLKLRDYIIHQRRCCATIPIQDVTKQTGITVRTLRYYDQIGLLNPSAKTPGGHRIYSHDDLMRLKHIQFLKQMGFRLQEIDEMLTIQDRDWSASLNNQLAYVLEEQEKLKQMENYLRELLHSMAFEGEAKGAAVRKLIQLSGRSQETRKKYRKLLFEEHEQKLVSRLPKVNGDDPDSLEWIGLIAQLRKNRDAGPDAPQVQRIVRRILEKTDESFSGEDEFLDKLWKIRKCPEQSAQIGMYPLEPELLELFEQAYEVYLTRQQTQHPEQEADS